MASDWVKSRDREFQEQVGDLIAIIATYHGVWGLTHKDVTLLKQCKECFDAALAEQTKRAGMYHAAVSEKQTRRNDLERALRALVRRINNHPGMTDSLRRQMNLASPTGTRTRSVPIEESGDEKGTNHE